MADGEHLIYGGLIMKQNLLIVALCVAVASLAGSGCKKQGGTIENLKSAITGETTASAKYAAYAKKAKEEKLDRIALLFEAASKAEATHAKKHTAVLAALGDSIGQVIPQFTVKSTKENLEGALKGETHEVESMYPDFIKKAKEEAKDDAVTTFDYAFQVEKIHQGFYRAAIDALDKNDLKNLADSYSVCPICGNTFAGKGPANCGICGAAQASFISIK